MCKNFLVSICPADLFPNTKYDQGACKKRHDDFFKLQFNREHDLKRLLFERAYILETMKSFEAQVSVIDNKVKKMQSKQDVALYRGEIPLEYQEK